MAGIAEMMQAAQALGAYKKIPQDTAVPDAATNLLSGVAKGAGWNETPDEKLARAIKIMQTVELMQKIKQQKLDSAISLEGAKQAGLVGMGSLGEPTTPQDNNAIRNALLSNMFKLRNNIDKPLQQKTEAGIADMAVKKGAGNAGRKFKTTYGSDGKWATAEEPETLVIRPKLMNEMTGAITDAPWTEEIKKGDNIPVHKYDPSKGSRSGTDPIDKKLKDLYDQHQLLMGEAKAIITKDEAGRLIPDAMTERDIKLKQAKDVIDMYNKLASETGRGEKLKQYGKYNPPIIKKKKMGMDFLSADEPAFKDILPAGTILPELEGPDKEAFEWANENPEDERAVKIIQKLKAKHGF
jgi:hypothetical protein